MRRRALAVFVLTWCAAPPLLAQSEPPVQEPGGGVLAGPRVPSVSRTSLVERESDGTIRRTEVPPEIAALRLLDLPSDVAGRIDEIVQKRGRFLESFVENNLELLSKLDTAGKTNDKLDQALLGLEALSKLAPLSKEGSLKKQIRALLPKADAERFDAILKEYWDAIVAQERSKDAKKSRFEIQVGERLQSLVRELTSAFQRLEKSGILLYRYLFHEIQLSKEQETEIRALLEEFVEETKGSPTKQQEQQIFMAVMSKLDSRQQTELVRRFKSNQPEGKPPRVKKKVESNKEER